MKNILTIAADPSIQPGFLPEELHGFVRTVAEIENNMSAVEFEEWVEFLGRIEPEERREADDKPHG